MTPPLIPTARLMLRPFRLADFDAFAELHASPHAALMWGIGSRDRAWEWFLGLAGEAVVRGAGHWALADRWSDAFLGHVGFMQDYDKPEAELIWALVEPAQGRGLAAEGVAAARDWGRLNGRARPVSFIDSRNARSIRLAERLGARLEARRTFAPDAVSLAYRHPEGP